MIHMRYKRGEKRRKDGEEKVSRFLLYFLTGYVLCLADSLFISLSHGFACFIYRERSRSEGLDFRLNKILILMSVRCFKQALQPFLVPCSRSDCFRPKVNTLKGFLCSTPGPGRGNRLWNQPFSMPWPHNKPIIVITLSVVSSSIHTLVEGGWESTLRWLRQRREEEKGRAKCEKKFSWMRNESENGNGKSKNQFGVKLDFSIFSSLCGRAVWISTQWRKKCLCCACR